jgi:hypothetical protein
MGYGYIVGGKGGKTFSGEYSNIGTSVGMNGEFLAGGGAIHAGSTNVNSYAGDGGVGGGGGMNYKTSNTHRAYGGTGGDGIVIIQYLPA